MLFGHQDINRLANADVTNAGTAISVPATNSLATDSTSSASLPVVPDDLENENLDSSASVLNQSPDHSLVNQPASAAVITPAQNNQTTTTLPSLNAVPNPATAPTSPTSTAIDTSLLVLKQQALGQLEPLVDHLDQTPEEKFRTTMMLIQSADNQALIKTAYDAAQAIIDDKTRAQALLDVVNEINYFTQKTKTT